MIEKKYLKSQYLDKKKSAKQIAALLDCSENKVNYWLDKHGIKKRSVSEAVYIKSNPTGDPFTFHRPETKEEWLLYGLGMGLWWGEGNKASKTSVRIGNTDPELLKTFLRFLDVIFGIDKSRLRFGLQIFSDIDEDKAKKYWCRKLQISGKQFQKVIVSKPVAKGSYTKKSEYGVLTIYFSNTKLRDNIYRAIEVLRTEEHAILAQSVERIHGGSQ